MEFLLLALVALLPFSIGKPVNRFKELLTQAYFEAIDHPVLCEHNGLTFFPGEDIYQERSGCKIKGVKCGLNGKVVVTERRDCRGTTAATVDGTSLTITTPVPSKPNCLYEGVEYYPGQQIYEGRHESWCFGAVCSEEGHLIKWDNLDCDVSTTSQAMTTVAADFNALPVGGCLVDGLFYLQGEKIKGTTKDDECFEISCGEDGVEKYRIPDC